MKIFVSHSSKDAELVEALVHLFTLSLRLSSSDIRCSSIDGHRLPGGARTEDTLRREVTEAEAFVVLLSLHSIEAPWVTFEMGARWGAGKVIVPVLGPGVSTALLTGPLRDRNALSCDSRSQLHQLIHDLASQLAAVPEPPAAYDKHIDTVLGFGHSTENDRSDAENNSDDPSGPSKEAWDGLFSTLFAGGKKFGEQLVTQVRSVKATQIPDSRKIARLKVLFTTELNEVSKSLEKEDGDIGEKAPAAGIGMALINRAVRTKKQALEASLSVIAEKDAFSSAEELFDEVEQTIRSITDSNET